MFDTGTARSHLLITPVTETDFDTLAAGLMIQPHAVVLDSGGDDLQRGRWRFAMADPFHVLTAEPDGRCHLDGAVQTESAFVVLNELLARYTLPRSSDVPPFIGGAAGLVSYEMGRILERLPAPKATMPSPALMLGFYDVVLAQDRQTGATSIVANGWPEEKPSTRLRRAEERTAWLLALQGSAATPSVEPVSWHAVQSRAEVCAAIERTRHHIEEGDIFQANITQTFQAARPAGLTPQQAYAALTKNGGAPFGAYVDTGSYQLLSVSPERFLQIDASGRVETRPIKGTRPRGCTDAEDAALKADLLASEKDRAENLMIVDLLRNDLSRCCVPGTVTVPHLHSLESFRDVHHLVSVVTGQLEDRFTAVDQFAAAFPGGSITGAPKIRAMEIIHDLESGPRGPYCGSVVAFGFDGALDSSIVIRTLVLTDDKLTVQAGGGIVWDSDPAAEYEESVLKARPLLELFGEFDG